MNLDPILSTHIDAIQTRLTNAELNWFGITGATLRKIYETPHDQLPSLLYSGKVGEMTSADLHRIKIQLDRAHKHNMVDLHRLFNDVTAEVYEEGQAMGKAKGVPISPKKEYRAAANPLLLKAYRDYEVMARSTTTNYTYRQAINKYVNRLIAEPDNEGYPSILRKTIRELTEQGISTIDYASGRSVRMDSAVRNSLMTEFTNVIQETQLKLAEDIGTDGWEVSAHIAPAEDHAEIQGMVFTNEEYEKLQAGDIAEDIDGNKHQTDRAIGIWNCKHISFPFLIGISERAYDPERLEQMLAENEKGINHNGENISLYEATQEQRRLETAMRRERENLNLLKEVRDTDPRFEQAYQKSRARLAELRNEYKSLGAALEPAAIRMKWDRSYVPAGSMGSNSQNRVVAMFTGDEEQIAKLNNPGIMVTSEKELKQGLAEFKKHIQNMDEPYRTIYSQYAENTKMQNEPLRMVAIGYDPEKDMLIYNKKFFTLPKYQQPANIVFSHELAHRYDILAIKSWENKEFMGAIEVAMNKVKSDIGKYNELYSSIKNANPAFQDILSALSDNKINVQYKHDSLYWSKGNNLSLEIFANISYIRANKINTPEFDGLLNDLIKIVNTMFNKGVK